MGSLRSQTLTGLTIERWIMVASWGSAKVEEALTRRMVSPDISMSWSHSGLSGPTFKKRPLENLFSEINNCTRNSWFSLYQVGFGREYSGVRDVECVGL